MAIMDNNYNYIITCISKLSCQSVYLISPI